MTRMSGAGMALCFIVFTALVLVQIKGTRDERLADELATEAAYERVAAKRTAYMGEVAVIAEDSYTRAVEELTYGDSWIVGGGLTTLGGELSMEDLEPVVAEAYERVVEEVAEEAYTRAVEVMTEAMTEPEEFATMAPGGLRLDLTWETVVKFVISLFGLLFSFLLLFVKSQPEDTRKWAMTTIGTIIGFWLGQAGGV